MKIIELKKVPKNKIGKLNKNGVKLEPHEEKTVELLLLYGFNIEIIIPSNTPKIRNPDILMFGTIWEMKAPIRYNKNTIQKKNKKAAKQAKKIIYDLRNVKQNYNKLERYIVELFIGNTGIRRMILITDKEKVLDFRKK